MFAKSILVATVALLVASGDQDRDARLDERAAGAIKAAETTRTPKAYYDALEATWRADDWRAALRIARQALATMPDEDRLWGVASRAFYRAGQIIEAERLIARVPENSKDRVALRMMIADHLGRCEFEQAETVARHFQQVGPQTAEDYYSIFAARFARGQHPAEQARLLKRMEGVIDPTRGYPEHYLEESIVGVADFLAKISNEPLNQIASPGAAPISALPLLNLPACDVMINGQGPFRLVLDTGGSIMVSLDTAVAEQIGLESLASAAVRGVSGTQTTGQALIDDLAIGTIRCSRVMARIFDVRNAVMGAADGIIGTGIFVEGRMTLDFANGQVIVEPSSDDPAPGHETPVRLIGDAKLMCPVPFEDHTVVAMLDTGADAVVVAPSKLAELFPNQKVRKFNPGMGIGVGSTELPKISIGQGVDFELAGKQYEDYGGLGLDALDDTLSPILGVQADLLVGMPIFRQMRSMTVDFPKGKLWIEWVGQ